MNLRSAQAITGCQIELEHNEEGYFVVALRDGKPIATAGGGSLKKSLRELVERVYALNRKDVFKEAGYRCVRCGAITGLTAHHVKHRARGQRDDSKDNLEALCSACHRKEHGG